MICEVRWPSRGLGPLRRGRGPPNPCGGNKQDDVRRLLRRVPEDRRIGLRPHPERGDEADRRHEATEQDTGTGHRLGSPTDPHELLLQVGHGVRGPWPRKPYPFTAWFLTGSSCPEHPRCMTRPESIPRPIWDIIPSEAQAVVAAVIAAAEARIAALEARVAELEERLNQSSANSSRPPSGDPPHLKPAPPRGPSGRKRGGQPGHRRDERIRLEPDEVVDARPERCRRCGEALDGDDPEPLDHQVFEVPVVRPYVVEYRLHRLICPRCGASTCGVAPAGAEAGYGPTGPGRMRRAVGRGADEQATRRRRDAGPLRPADQPGVGLRVGASHRRRAGPDPRRGPRTHSQAPRQRRRDELAAGGSIEAGSGRPWRRAWRVFRVASSRGRDAFEELMGRSPPSVVTSDRYSAYSHLPAERSARPAGPICAAIFRR